MLHLRVLLPPSVAEETPHRTLTAVLPMLYWIFDGTSGTATSSVSALGVPAAAKKRVLRRRIYGAIEFLESAKKVTKVFFFCGLDLKIFVWLSTLPSPHPSC